MCIIKFKVAEKNDVSDRYNATNILRKSDGLTSNLAKMAPRVYTLAIMTVVRIM